jgi:hypothetical protein
LDAGVNDICRGITATREERAYQNLRGTFSIIPVNTRGECRQNEHIFQERQCV